MHLLNGYMLKNEESVLKSWNLIFFKLSKNKWGKRKVFV